MIGWAVGGFVLSLNTPDRRLLAGYALILPIILWCYRGKV